MKITKVLAACLCSLLFSASVFASNNFCSVKIQNDNEQALIFQVFDGNTFVGSSKPTGKGGTGEIKNLICGHEYTLFAVKVDKTLTFGAPSGCKYNNNPLIIPDTKNDFELVYPGNFRDGQANSPCEYWTP